MHLFVHLEKNTYHDESFVDLIVFLFIELLFKSLIVDCSRPFLSQENILCIALKWLKMGDHPHACALILEVNHILCTSSDVNWTSAQLLKIMATEMSCDIAELLRSIANLRPRSTAFATAKHSPTDTAWQIYIRVWMNIRIINLTLKPIRRTMHKTRNVVFTVSAVEQSRITFKNLLCLIRKRRVLSRAFELFKTMLNESMVNYQSFILFERNIMFSSKRGLSCGTPTTVWKACVCFDIHGTITGCLKCEHFDIIPVNCAFFNLSFDGFERTWCETGSFLSNLCTSPKLMALLIRKL